MGNILVSIGQHFMEIEHIGGGFGGLGYEEILGFFGVWAGGWGGGWGGGLRVGSFSRGNGRDLKSKFRRNFWS